MELPRGLPAKPCQLALELPCPRLCLVIFISSIVIIVVIIKEIIIILVVILLSISSSGSPRNTCHCLFLVNDHLHQQHSKYYCHHQRNHHHICHHIIVDIIIRITQEPPFLRLCMVILIRSIVITFTIVIFSRSVVITYVPSIRSIVITIHLLTFTCSQGSSKNSPLSGLGFIVIRQTVRYEGVRQATF